MKEYELLKKIQVILFIYFSLINFTPSLNAQKMEVDQLRKTNLQFEIPEGFYKEKQWYKSEKYKAMLTVSPIEGYLNQSFFLSKKNKNAVKISGLSKTSFSVETNYRNSDIVLEKGVLEPLSSAYILKCTVRDEEEGVLFICVMGTTDYLDEIVKSLQSSFKTISYLSD